MKRRTFFKNSFIASSVVCISPTFLGVYINNINANSKLVPDSLSYIQPGLIPVPDNPEAWTKYRELLINWRKEAKARLNYNDILYKDPDFSWVSSAFNCYFLLMYDELFYDNKIDKYKVEEFLNMGEKEFGRLDIVVLWHAYPRIGLDERNQFDFYREMPGGLAGIRKISDQFHRRGVKVYLNYNPWDTGTKREDASDIDCLAQITKEIDADGIFLDTMSRGASDFRKILDQAKRGVVMESELALPIEDIHNHHMSWAQWLKDSKAPGILRNKWFERRHIQHGISRWEQDRTKELHIAWMNGSGIMIWDNIFGQLIGWNERDKSILRSMSPIQKRYADLFSGEGWLPLVEETKVNNVYTSLWYSDNIRLWTLVNRSENSIEGDLLPIERKDGEHYYDLIQGMEVEVSGHPEKIILAGNIIPRGIVCFIAGKPQILGNDFQSFLDAQADVYKTLVTGTDFPAVQPVLKPVNPTIRYDKPVQGMVEIPAFKGSLEVVFRVREIGFYNSVDKYFLNAGIADLHQNMTFSIDVNFSKFLMDEVPVTNSQYQKFLKETKYTPNVGLNFLKHWIKRNIPHGKEDHPVVFVSLDDARAYASWAGKRLPTEFEWQFAGQSLEKLNFPWGEKMQAGCCNIGKKSDTTPVKAYPKGRSVFGCYDMVGNTWELTESEYCDRRTRWCILKGGSFYKAKGSDWYFDGGPKPLSFSAKQMLIYPGIDRCSTIGFRCVTDI